MHKEATLKGNQIKLLKEFIERRFGEDAVQKICGQLGPECAGIISKNYLDISRFPEDVYVELLDKMEEAYGSGNRQLCRDAGSYLAHESIPQFYSVFVEKADPHFIIKRASRFWRSVHNTGNIRFESSGDDRTIGYLRDFKYLTDNYITVLLGFFEGIAQLLKRKITKLTAKKHTENGCEYCEFTIEWK